jgi:hypothetical protein
MTGVFTEEEGPADGQMASLAGLNSSPESDSVFDQLFAEQAVVLTGEAETKPQVLQVAAPAPDVDDSVLEVVLQVPEVPEAPSVKPVPVGLSRAERFRSAGFVASHSSAPTPVQPVAPEQPASSRTWDRFVDPNNKPEAVTARQSMAAAKVLTPLIAAVSFAPGRASTSKSKSEALREMLVGMHRSAVATAESISEHMGRDVPSWMVTQLMQSMAQAIARRWEHGHGADMDSLASNMRSLFGSSGPEIDALIQGASEDAYIPVNHPDVARFRISVSTANAAWVLFDWVNHPRLSLDNKGDMPTRFFTFHRKSSDLVNMMLLRCVNECRGLVAQVESADLRTAHMQSSILRMANLMGAEYVTRTRHLMDWIADPTITDEEYQIRFKAAVSQLETHMLPEIYEYARVTFLRIERGAFQTIEDLNEKTNSKLVPGVSSRPVAS